MVFLNDVLLKLANSPSGPQYELLRMMYLFIFENALKSALPGRTVKVNNAMDLAFASWKRQTKDKKIHTIDEFEDAVIDRLFLHEQLFKNVPHNTNVIFKKMVADARNKKANFCKKYYGLYYRAICNELKDFPPEVHTLVEEAFSRLIFRHGPINDPKNFFDRMKSMVAQMAATKGYNVPPLQLEAPMPKDPCAPRMPDVINRRTYKSWNRLEWLKEMEAQKQYEKRKQEYKKRTQGQPKILKLNRPQKSRF